MCVHLRSNLEISFFVSFPSFGVVLISRSQLCKEVFAHLN